MCDVRVHPSRAPPHPAHTPPDAVPPVRAGWQGHQGTASPLPSGGSCLRTSLSFLSKRFGFFSLPLAPRAPPVVGEILEPRPRRNIVLRIALRGVVNISAGASVSLLPASMRFLAVRPEICLHLPSDPASRRTPLVFGYTLPAAGWVRDFHPLDFAHVGRTSSDGATLFRAARFVFSY